jgi:inorganic pyrophosphatase
MANLQTLPTYDGEGQLVCVVESPRGSVAKFKYDPEREVFILNRALILGVRYPYDWGFVPSTVAADGDPLDVMMFHDVPTYPGVVLGCEAIGALLVTQKCSDGDGRQPNHRLLAIPAGSEREHQWKDARDLSGRIRKELEQFFVAAAALADKELHILDWVGPSDATTLVTEAMKKFRASQDVAGDGREKK